jgi:hypothetical protein
MDKTDKIIYLPVSIPATYHNSSMKDYVNRSLKFYEKKMYNGDYILEITPIYNRHTEAIIPNYIPSVRSNRNINDKIDIIIECLAKVKNINYSNLIAEVITVKRDVILCKKDNIINRLIIDKRGVPELKETMLLPLIITESTSTHLTAEITTKSILYPYYKIEVYKLDKVDGNNEFVIKCKKQIKNLINEINSKDNAEYFNNLLYAYKADRSKVTDITKVSIYDGDLNGYYTRFDILHILDEELIKLDEKIVIEKYSKFVVITISSLDGILKILQSYCSQLQMLYDICTTYDDSIFKKHEILWKFYENIKR